MFPWNRRNNRASGQGVIRILRIILANCESSVSIIRGLWVNFANCSPWVSEVSRYVQLEGDITHNLARRPPDTCTPTSSREKKECTFSRDMSRELRSSFFLAPGSPFFRHLWKIIFVFIYSISIYQRGARGVVVIVVGIGHGDTSSNPGRDWLHFT